MAANIGSGDYGKLKTPPDQILNRFVEMELDVGYPNNFHMTQVHHADFVIVFHPLKLTLILRFLRCCGWLYKYVGCVDSVRAIEGVEGGNCRIQVCRYAVMGNCAVVAHRFVSVNWKGSVLNDDLRQCGADYLLFDMMVEEKHTVQVYLRPNICYSALRFERYDFLISGIPSPDD